MLQYTLSLPNPSSHLFHVTIDVMTDGAEYLDLEFPAWSPGRYYIYDFAKNVQELVARSEAQRALRVEKIAKGTWRVRVDDAERVSISYKMFGDNLSGTFSQLDDRHASINGSSVFGYIVGHEREEIELAIDAPAGWKAYAALPKRRRAGRQVMVATNYDLLIDSPIEIGTPLARRFVYDGVTYHMILDIAGSEGVRKSKRVKEKIERYVADTEKIVRAQVDTFGRPEFDEYYFLVNINPYAESGDGMEHLHSTRLVLNGYITNDDNYNDLLDVTSHEFFHIWNVKRLRPAELGPFDYTRELHTTLLWFAEGFTQYYGHLMVRRAGVWDDKQFFKELVGEINAVDRSPGRKHRNLRESSFDTWQAGGPRGPGGPSNFRNTWVNYYNKGAVVALALDMEIRRLTNDKRSLDDVIRELYKKHYEEMEVGEYFLRGSGYSEQDVYDAVSKVAGRSMRSFMKHAIESTEEIDYARYLKHVGLDVTRKPPASKNGEAKKEEGEKPQLHLGLITPEGKGRAEFVSVVNVLDGSRAAAAGISPGDQIIAVDGERVDARTWESVMGMKSPGEKMEITLFRGPRLLTFTVTAENRDSRPYKIVPSTDATAKQKNARKRWLSA